MMRRHGLFAAALAALALCSGAAFGLDIADVKNLVVNNVDEAVIVGMVQQGGALSATQGDVDELRAMGASETLLSAVSGARALAPQAGEYVLQDGTTAAVPPTVYYDAPATVAPQPPVVYYEPPVVVTPTYVYPYPHYPRRHYYRSRPGINFSFGFGNSGRRRHRPYRRWR